MGDFPSTNERLYLCHRFCRNVDPDKDILFNRELPLEYATYIDCLRIWYNGTDSDETAVPWLMLVELYREWYTHLCDLEDDEELQPFREMTQRVASRLNTLDWSKITQVTDGFVIYPADGSHTFCDDIGDPEASISRERPSLLRSRHLLIFPA